MSLKNEVKFWKRIGFKITLWYSLSVLVILIIAGSFLYYRLQHRINRDAEHLLLGESKVILQPFLEGNYGLEDLSTSIESVSSFRKVHQITVRLLDVKQNPLVSSTSFLDPFLMASEEAIANVKNGRKTMETIRVEGKSRPYLLLTKPVVQNGSTKYILQMTMYLRDVYKSSGNFKKNITMLIPGLIVITVIGGWFIARKSIAPVGEITKAAQEITSLNMDIRLKPIHTGDELEELTNTINLMLSRLDNSFKKLTQFTSDVSHELRTPIATLRVGTEVALGKKMTVAEHNELLERFLPQFEKMTRMIEDLLVLLRSDSGAKSLHLKSFNLRSVLTELYNTFSMLSESKNVGLSIEKMADVQIDGDEILLHRVFSNLLDNAIKYTLLGGNVHISLEDSDNNVLVRIKDTGVGIPDDHKEQIFDRFYRVDSSRSRETGGVGLGLSICKNIIELHNGKIEVRSTLGAGSTFIVTLPKNGIA
ncbi:MAG: heavy metal sensor histidine kinase [Candidatus Anammoxibacter sp.]